MKINTNISKNFFACFDEARGFAIYKKRILENNKNKCLSYSQRKLIIFIFLIILSMLLKLLCCINYHFCILSFFLYLASVIYLIAMLVNILTIYRFRKKQKFNNTIIIDKNGITDESYYGIKMIFSFDKINAIVVGKYTVTILTDTPCYFYFDVKEKENIIKAIEKYNKEVRIIN